MSFVPETYEEWEHCITVKCGIPLTPDYVTERIAALEDRGDFHTQKFVDFWGEAHLNRTIGWFKQAEARLSQ